VPFPAGISINGIDYPILPGDNAFVIEEQSTVQQQADFAGASRPSKTARPDILEWRWDDWSGGEGQTWIDASKENSFKKYLSSDLAVDVSVPGQISLGKVATSESTGIGTIAGANKAPVLSVLSEKPWVFWDNQALERTAALTWTARTTNVASNGFAQQGIAFGTFIYVGYRGVGGEVMRINTATAGATWSSSAASHPIYVDGRLYFLSDSGSSAGGTALFRSADLASPATLTSVASFDGQTGSSMLCSIGHDVYFCIADAGQTARLYRYDGDKGTLFADLPSGFRVTSFDDNNIVSQNGVLFLGGYHLGATSTATLLYFIPGGPSGVIGEVRKGTSMTVRTLFPDKNNGVLIGTDTGHVFRYDMGTGGLSLFASGQAAAALGGGLINSIAEANGLYYFATRTASDGTGTGEVYSTNVGTYPDETIVTGSKWDFLFPEEEKILLTATVQASIPSGCTVKIAFKFNDGSAVTTDAAGATMSMSSSDGATKSFTISNAGTERSFRFLQPFLYLDTNTGGAKTSTPDVYAVTMKATTTGKQKFIRAVVDLSDQTPNTRPRGRQVTGTYLGQTLETLVDDSANRIVTVKPYFEKSDAPRAGSSDSYVCTIDASRFTYDRKGEGRAELLFRIIS